MRKTNQLQFSFDYTEPIVENHLLEIEGEANYDTNDNDVNQSKYENDVLQTPLIYSEYYRETDVSGKIRYKYNIKKLTFSTGVRLLEQTQDFGLEDDVNFKNVYTNLNPEANLRYRPQRGEHFRFNLRKSVDLPRLSQITPVVNNFNPLFIRQGNPDLIPEDRYSVNIKYGKHNFSSGLSIYTRLGYNHSKNSIGNTEFTDELGIRYSSYENLGDKDNLSSSVYLGNRVNSLGLRYGIRLRGSYSEYFSKINDVINETQTKNGTLGLSLENNKKEKIDASISATWKKNYTTFTSGNNADRDYLQQTYFSKLDWNVTNRFNVNSQFKYDLYTDSNFGTDQAVPIWNGTVSYALTEAKSMMLMLSALDILNKNIGLERNSTDNYFEEVQRDVLGNYYMLSLTYNLNGNKAPKKK